MRGVSRFLHVRWKNIAFCKETLPAKPDPPKKMHQKTTFRSAQLPHRADHLTSNVSAPPIPHHRRHRCFRTNKQKRHQEYSRWRLCVVRRRKAERQVTQVPDGSHSGGAVARVGVSEWPPQRSHQYSSPASSWSLPPFFSTRSATMASVVRSREATLAAFCRALRVTLVGSMTPATTRSS